MSIIQWSKAAAVNRPIRQAIPKEPLMLPKAQLDLFPENWPIVVPSGSCGGMMKHHWPTLFKGTGTSKSH